MLSVPRPGQNRFYLAFNPDFNPEECPMKFRLTYEGTLESSGNKGGTAPHKHRLRKAFHPQLKRLWESDPNLTKWLYHPKNPDDGELRPAWKKLAEINERCGYHFVPVASVRWSLLVSLEILFLRVGTPGTLIESGDIDGRLKTLLDALRMPSNKDELGGYVTPDAEEEPFFVLLEDDKLVNHVAVESDALLEPTINANGQFLRNDARLVITVHMKPYSVNMDNLHFA